MLSSWKYSSLNSLISEDAECKAEPAWTEDCDSDETSHSRSRYSYIRIVSPWIVSTAFFAVLTTYFGYHSISHPAASLPGPFETDFQAARDWVEYEERRFTGALDYDVVTGQAYRHVDLSQPQYFGEPSPEIEEAWDGLLRSKFSPRAGTSRSARSGTDSHSFQMNLHQCQLKKLHHSHQSLDLFQMTANSILSRLFLPVCAN